MRCRCGARARPGSRGYPPPTAPRPTLATRAPPPPRRVKLHRPLPHLTSPRPALASAHGLTHPPTHPPRLASIHSDHAPPIFALSTHLHFPVPVSVLDTGAPRARPPPTSPWPRPDPEPTRPCSGGRRARTAAGGRAPFSLPRRRASRPMGRPPERATYQLIDRRKGTGFPVSLLLL